jgi:hypothetical protein
MKPFIAFAALAALAPHAAAQPLAAKPQPADPTASVPATKYESAFSSYRGFREEPLAPWRDVNVEVARAGGHISIVGGEGRNPLDPGIPAAKPPASPAKSAPDPARGAPQK